MRTVSHADPCRVCGGDHKCASNGRLHLCGRRAGPVASFRHLGPCADPTWHKYLDGADAGSPPEDNPSACPPPPGPPLSGAGTGGGQSRAIRERFARLADNFTKKAAEELSALLDLPASVFSRLGVGYQPGRGGDGPKWCFPERDGEEELCGWQTRDRGGVKRSQGSRGLTIPGGWRQFDILFVPEGASDTLALLAVGLSAVGRPSNTAGVAHLVELTACLPLTSEVCIVGENDRKADGTWPGRDGAVQVANKLKEQTGRNVTWTLPPEGFKDVRDWVRAQNLRGPFKTDADRQEKGSELKRLLRANAKVPDLGEFFRKDPQPFPDEPPTAAFPLEVFPAPVYQFVVEAADSLNCPVDYLACAVLTLAGAAVGNAWRLRIHRAHLQSAALFCALVGPPGTLKSPALALVCKPLHEANAEWVEAYHRLKEQQEAVNIKKLPPPPRRCVVDDFTMESLAPILQANPKGVAIVKDELAALICGLNQYKGGRGSDRQNLLSIWSGGDAAVDRKGSPGPLLLRAPFAAVLGGIQPSVLDMLRTKGRDMEAGDGLIDRFLFSCPEPPIPCEERWVTVSEEAELKWARAVRRLLDLPVTPGEGGKWRWQPIDLSTEGREAWADLVRHHVAECHTDEVAEELAGVWSKMRGYAGRLALVLHALEWAASDAKAPPLVVSPDSVRRAEAVLLYFKSHAKKAYAVLREDPAVASAKRVLGWLARRPHVKSFTRTALHASLRRVQSRAGLWDEALGMLVERGYLLELNDGKTRRWQVNPRWARGAGVAA